MNGGQPETTYMVCEAKLGSKRGTQAKGTPKRQKENRGHEGMVCGLRNLYVLQRPRLSHVPLNPLGRYAEKI